MATKGIDVSHFQGAVNWRKVRRTGVVFAFAKATEGINTVDSAFSTNWNGMADAGIIRGAYHFFSAGRDATQQAQHFIDVLGTIEANDMPPVLDLEDRVGIAKYKVTRPQLINSVNTFLSVMTDAYGVVPIIYADPSFWKQYMSPVYGSYPLWIANPHVTRPIIPDDWEDYTFWQYENRGRVDGIAPGTNVDLNYFNGTTQELIDFAQGNSMADSGGGSCSSSGGGASSGGSSGTRYVIQSGDTLFSVSRKFGVSVQEIANLNGISDPGQIRVGQVLKIP